MLRLDPTKQQDLRDGEDSWPFRWIDLLGEDARYMARDDRIEQYDDALSHLIEGHIDGDRAAIGRRIENAGLLDRLTAEICAHECCDPAVLVALAIVTYEDVQLQHAADDENWHYLDRDNGPDSKGCLTTMRLSDDVSWVARGGVIVTLPDSVLQGVVGRPLREVVSHPVLDRWALTITGWGEDLEAEDMFLRTDHDRRAITAEELLKIRPAAAERRGKRRA